MKVIAVMTLMLAVASTEIQDYFSYRRVRETMLFTCSIHDTFHLTKKLSAMNVWSYVLGSSQRFSPLEKVARQTYYQYGVLLDYTCLENERVLEHNSERMYLNTSFHWLIWDRSDHVPDDVTLLNLRLDSEVAWVTVQNETYYIHDMYKMNLTWPVIQTHAGEWNPQNGLNYHLNDYKYRRRSDLQGLNFRGGIVANNIPWDNLAQRLVDPANKHKDTMATFNYQIFLYLQKMFNFTITLHTGKTFGFVVEEGNFDGLTKMIAENQVDVGVSTLLFKTHRIDHIQFSAGSSWKFRLCAIFRHPPVTGGFDALTKPFAGQLWLCAMLMWLLIGIFLRFLSFMQLKIAEGHHEDIDDKHSWGDVMLLIVGTLAEQGSALDSRWITWRLVFFQMLLLTVLLNNYYGACVVSSLLSEAPLTIKTVRDLIDSSVKFGAEDINYNVPYFEINKDPLVHELYVKKMVSPRRNKPAYYSREEGVKKMLHEEFAYHIEPIHVYDLIEETFPDHEKCSLTEIELFPVEMCYCVMPYKSPYRELFTYGLSRLTENGILTHTNLEWRPKKPTCSSKAEVISVGMVYVVVAFGLLAGGIVISAIILLFEMLRKRREKMDIEELKKNAITVPNNFIDRMSIKRDKQNSETFPARLLS